MKALFVLTDRFPDSGACSSLLVKMFDEGKLADKLGQVHVLIPKYSKDDPSLETVGKVTVHRALMPAFLPAAELKKMKSRPDILLRGILAKLWDRKLARRVQKNRFLQDCFLGDLTRSICKLHAKEQFQVLIPIAGSYEVAAAAMKVAQRKNIKLLLYQVDPCTTNASYSRNSLAAREQLEDALYHHADAVITTPIIRAERQAAGKPELEKVTAMEFPNVSTEPIITETRKPTEKLTCVFAGRIYHGIRNPAYTVKLFEQLTDRNIQLHMYGVTDEELASFKIKPTAGTVFCHGLCPLEQVQEKIRQADIVVNIGNIMTNQVPSKIFEYISSCKPIINIAANSNCPSVAYLNRYPRALTLVEGENGVAENAARLAAFVEENAGKMADQQTVLERFRECTAVHCAGTMAREIKRIYIENGD